MYTIYGPPPDVPANIIFTSFVFSFISKNINLNSDKMKKALPN